MASRFDRVMGLSEWAVQAITAVLSKAKKHMTVSQIVAAVNRQGTVYGDLSREEVKEVLDAIDVEWFANGVKLI